MIRTAVVLPAPFGPSSPVTVASETTRSSPSSAVVSPYRFCSPSSTIASGILLFNTGPTGPFDQFFHEYVAPSDFNASQAAALCSAAAAAHIRPHWRTTAISSTTRTSAQLLIGRDAASLRSPG